MVRITLGLFLILGLCGWGSFPLQSDSVTATSTTYLIDEDFEGTNADWTTGSGATSSVSLDYTTYVIGGSQSAHLTGTATSEAYALSPAFTANSTIGVAFKLRMVDYGSDSGYEIKILDASSATLAYLRLASATSWRIYHGTADSGYQTVSAATGTNLCVWIDYSSGSGADGTMSLYVQNATGIAPNLSCSSRGTAVASITTGTSTANATKIRFRRNYGTQEYIFDDVLVDSSAIGNF